MEWIRRAINTFVVANRVASKKRDLILLLITMVKMGIRGRKCREIDEIKIHLKNGIVLPICGKGISLFTISYTTPKKLLSLSRVNKVKDGYEYIFLHRGLKYVTDNPGTWLAENLHDDYILPISNYITKKDPLIVDVGGYKGDTLVLFKALWAKSKLIIYEPLKENTSYIKRNIDMNHLEKMVVLNKGVCDRNGEKIVYTEAPKGDPSFGRIKNNHNITTYLIKCTTFREVLRVKPDVVKIDCEGCEQYLLNEKVKDLRKAQIYIMEIHDKRLNEKIVRKLMEAGYTPHFLKKTRGGDHMWLFTKN